MEPTVAFASDQPQDTDMLGGKIRMIPVAEPADGIETLVCVSYVSRALLDDPAARQDVANMLADGVAEKVRQIVLAR